MREILRESQHLVRAAALFALVFVVFLVARALLIPEGFGRFGHYRAGALDDARAQSVVFAGRAACEECHLDVVQARRGGSHERIGCEACHGALAGHAGDPGSVEPSRPDPAAICRVCHETSVSKPAGFPQVNPTEHSGGEACSSCHKPHHPDIS